MRIPVIQAAWRDYRINSIPVTAVMNCSPFQDAAGLTRAVQMGNRWAVARSAGAQGVLWLAPDVALDPDDLAAMTAAIAADPDLVHTGLVKLWPASTGRDDWIWSHRGGTLGNPAATQDETAPVAYFSMDCTWMPARLLNLADGQWAAWAWNYPDVALSELALAHAIPARVVPGCRPKHLHFTKEHHADTIADAARASAAGRRSVRN